MWGGAGALGQERIDNEGSRNISNSEHKPLITGKNLNIICFIKLQIQPIEKMGVGHFLPPLTWLMGKSIN